VSRINQSEINDVAWRACDTFRGVVDAENYRNYILVMLFWKYISDVWRDHRDKYLVEFKGDHTRVGRRLARERFQLPDGCDLASLHAQRNEPDIGERMNIALEKIEEANKAKLEGVFREVDFNSENKLGQTKDRNARLKLLLQDFNDPRLDLRPSVVGEEDVIGNVYEYLLERFASDAGKKAGEFYTPVRSPNCSPVCSPRRRATPSAIRPAARDRSSSRWDARPTSGISLSSGRR
jgi:type I restriction enzyme M protein